MIKNPQALRARARLIIQVDDSEARTSTYHEILAKFWANSEQPAQSDHTTLLNPSLASELFKLRPKMKSIFTELADCKRDHQNTSIRSSWIQRRRKKIGVTENRFADAARNSDSCRRPAGYVHYLQQSNLQTGSLVMWPGSTMNMTTFY